MPLNLKGGNMEKLKVHPIRAALAVISLLATIYMLVFGVAIPDAWWIIVTGLALFYVEAPTG